MEIKNVATFVKIVEYNNFTKAAESLGYSQAAVTVQIKTLEAELGVPLFDRIGKRIALTQEGRTFLPHAIELLKAEDAARNSVRPANVLTGELRICAASSYASEVLPGIVLRFVRQHPKVRVIAKVSDYEDDAALKLARGEIDFLLCLAAEDAFPLFRRVAQRKEPVIFVTNPAHPILKKKRCSVRDVADSELIVTDREIGYTKLLERKLKKQGIELNPAMEMGSVSGIINVLLDGYGISFIPAFMARKYLDEGRLVNLNLKSAEVDLYALLLCSRERWINPVMQAFIDVVNKDEAS